MNVRAFDFLDLPLLPRYRRALVPLDTARLLTRGNPLGAAALLSYLDLRHHIYTAVATENSNSLLGQVTLHEEETSARMTFLAPAEALTGLTQPLLEHLATEVGEWGAFHLLAEVDEDSPAFRLLRQAGFAMYAWQRVWKLPSSSTSGMKGIWRQAVGTDWPAVQSLYGQIVPALLAPLEALPRQVMGMVCSEGNLQAYVAVNSGPKGIWIQPVVPPDSDCVSGQLAGLNQAISDRRERDIYVCVRSYQAWLEAVLEDLGAEAGPRQAVMVKRLSKAVKDVVPVPVMEKVLAKAKPAAPMNSMGNEK